MKLGYSDYNVKKVIISQLGGTTWYHILVKENHSLDFDPSKAMYRTRELAQCAAEIIFPSATIEFL